MRWPTRSSVIGADPNFAEPELVLLFQRALSRVTFSSLKEFCFPCRRDCYFSRRMSSTQPATWEDFLKRYTWFETIKLGLDTSCTTIPLDYAEQNREMIERALEEMRALEAGAIANPDENRMVGHYWLRNPPLAPTAEIRGRIEKAITDVKTFAADIHRGNILGATGPFDTILLIGIGGSALGPQFVSYALSHPTRDKMAIHFLDNTDPDGFDRVFAQLEDHFGQTLCIVISKSGGTKETRNAMLETQAMYRKRGLDFAKHAVAITSEGSELHNTAVSNRWRGTFPMWDWIGGRTSVLSAVGLLPAALEGFDIDRLLDGSRACDNVTRSEALHNPAMTLALMMFYSGNGIGSKAMVVLPYKDRLEVISKYLQQLVMESLGKRFDRSGNEVVQGLSVYGNKGATDQHAYVQQLRDGLNNFFCVFIEVLKDRSEPEIEVDLGATSGDYLTGFLLGTRGALFDQARESLLITVEEINAFTVGCLIALFERAVGFYASFIGVNAYHQPGVEAGKTAAAEVLEIQSEVLTLLKANQGHNFTPHDIARRLSKPNNEELVFRVCEHLAANGRLKGVNIHLPSECRFGV